MHQVYVAALTLCLVYFAVAKQCTTCCNGKGSGSGNPEIDYVQLAVQNAKGYCHLNKCDTSLSGWSIHGLWPSQKGSMGPNSCNSTASFDSDVISSILSEMDKDWPTLYGGDSTGFWCHEWCKHGTCAVAGLDSVSSMMSYFQSGLQLFTNNNMDSVFQQNGIVASTSDTYKMSDLANLFSPSPAFECTSYTGDSGEGQLLYSARFCYTADLQPAECNMDWFVSVRPCKEDVPVYYL